MVYQKYVSAQMVLYLTHWAGNGNLAIITSMLTAKIVSSSVSIRNILIWLQLYRQFVCVNYEVNLRILTHSDVLLYLNKSSMFLNHYPIKQLKNCAISDNYLLIIVTEKNRFFCTRHSGPLKLHLIWRIIKYITQTFLLCVILSLLCVLRFGVRVCKF